MESLRDSLWPSSQMISRALGFFKVGLNQSLLENVLNLERQSDLLRVQIIEAIAEALTVQISPSPGRSSRPFSSFAMRTSSALRAH